MNVFLSYGHDEYDKLAHRLKRDLEAMGHRVWMDMSEIKGSADWEQSIENGIHSSDWFVILMTQHSCRRPDGVCLDEVSYARFLGKSIAPVMVENVKPPLCIARIQYIDMENFFEPGKVGFDEESYQKRLAMLADVLVGACEIAREGDFEVLRTKLVPLDNDVYYEHFRHDFYGRKELFEYYQGWLDGPEKVLWIVGDAGVGKTAFIAKLTENHEEIKAVHFCRYNDSDRADSKRAIMSLAYYLSTQNDEYRAILKGLHDLDRLQERSAERLFAYLLVEPLKRVHNERDTTVLVIDALDEATHEGRNALADIMSSRLRLLPEWVKIVITSRDEPMLRRKLSRIRPIRFDDKRFADNNGDIRGYFELKLSGVIDGRGDRDSILNTLVERSDGNFLYAKTVADEVLTGYLSVNELDEFPSGLTGVYTKYFDRLFASGVCDYRREVRPLLEILCAEFSPMPSDEIMEILDVDEYDFDDIKETISQMIPERNSVLEPVHKSVVDWLVDRRKAGRYRVSARKGHQRLSKYCLGLLDRAYIPDYALKYAIRHFTSADQIDDAIATLKDWKFLSDRIHRLGVDTALREYLYELGTLMDKGVDIPGCILSEQVFQKVFSTNRKYLYNTGLYFAVQDLGFDDVMDSPEIEWDLNAKIGIANYLYITERFDAAMVRIHSLLENSTILSSEDVVELNNLVALCHRKHVAFDESKRHFEIALRHGAQDDDVYDKSISAINLGKIAYHELDWSLARDWNLKALELLEKAYASTDSDDMHVTIQLFIAEYHRLIAECVIWNLEIDEAERHLSMAAETYHKVASRDRYYVRYVYTSALVSIMGGKIQRGLELCARAWDIATSKYDRSQILFYRGIALLRKGEVSDAAACVEEGMEYADQIGAWLEREELALLKRIALQNTQLMDGSSFLRKNEYTKRWIEHVLRTLSEVLS